MLTAGILLKFDVAEANYSFPSAKPTVFDIRGAAKSVAGIFDGTGSWGFGHDAAAWSRAHLQAHWSESCDELTVEKVARDVVQLSQSIPDEFRDEEFDCGFSAVVAVAEGQRVSIVAAGMFSVCLFRQQEKVSLFQPRKLVDQLVAERRLSPDDVADFPHKGIFVGSFVGDANPPDLAVAVHELQPGEVIVVAYRDLADALLPGHVSEIATARDIQSLGPPRSAGPAAVILLRP